MIKLYDKLKFEIEYISTPGRQVHLLCRCLIENPVFTLSEPAYLGRFLIKPGIIQPRATDKLGNHRADLFIFILGIRSDKAFIKPGDILEFSNTLPDF